MALPPGLALMERSWIIEMRFAMSLEQAILEVVRDLPADKQQEILNHAMELRDRATARKPLKNFRGRWADLGISLSAEEIDENRREMWKNFPREDI